MTSFFNSRRRIAIAACIAVAAIVAVVVIVSGGDDDRASLEEALGYVPADAALVTAIDTDLGDDQYEAFGRTLAPGLIGSEFGGFLGSDLPLANFETAVSIALRTQGLNYDGEIKPLLGGDLVVAGEASDSIDGVGDAIVVLELGSRGAAEKLLAKFELKEVGSHRGATLYGEDFSGDSGPDEAALALDGDVLVSAEDPALINAAIDRARGEDHMTVEGFEQGLEGIPDGALIRLRADPQKFLAVDANLQGLSSIPWIAAMRALGAGVSFSANSADLDLNVETDPSGLSDAQLPISPKTGEPRLVEREGEIASASLDQSQTTAFLLGVARASFADSRFIADVDALQKDLGIDFEQEVLRQFAGPSASSVTLEGEFAARSTLADPAAMKALLPKLAPRLPKLVRDLDALGRTGLLGLLLFAPDAPVATTPTGATDSVALPPAAPEEMLYEIKGPKGPVGLELQLELPERIVFGMIGETFVVASDPERARMIATAPAEPQEGLEGASVLHAADLSGAVDPLENLLGFAPGAVEEAEGSMQATIERLEASLHVNYGRPPDSRSEPDGVPFGGN